MNARWRKLLSLLLCLVLLAGMFPAAAMAEESEDEFAQEEHNHTHECECERESAPFPEDSEGNGALDATEEELDPDLVRVVFVCDPADAIITVYDPMNLDDNGEPLVIEPEEDGSWLLYPHEYLYDAIFCGGYHRASSYFLVKPSNKMISLIISVNLASSEVVDSQPHSADLHTATVGGVSSTFLSNCSASYKSGPYYTKLAALNLSGNEASNLVAVAYSQVGYHEGNSWDDISGSSTGTGDYTEYNRWYPVGAQAWCNLFVSWCFSAAGISSSYAPKNPFYLSQWRACDAGVYSWKDYKDGKVTPKPGDIIIYGASTTNNTSGSALTDSYQHVSIIADYSGGVFYSIDGNYSEKVTYHSFSPNSSTGYVSGSGYIHAIIQPSYNSGTNYLSQCEYYPSHVTATITSSDGAAVWSLPCNSSTDPDSTKLGTLPKGTEIEAVAMYKNGAGNYWYQISYNGNTGFVWCNHTEKKNVIYGTVTATGGNSTFSTIQKGKSYGVTWLLNAEYSELYKVVGVIRYHGWNDNAVIYNPSVSLGDRTTSYKLGSGGDSIDSGMLFNALEEGEYETYILAYVRNYYWDAGSSSVKSDWAMRTPIDFVFTVVSSGAHVHDKGAYMYYEADHPHRKCYKCSSCGTVWADPNSYTLLATCENCRPEKPVFIDLEGVHPANEPVVFTWNETARTTHYNIYVYKQTDSGTYDVVDHSFYVSSGFQLTLEPGSYKSQLQSYNSELWESDGSDWAHTWGDSTYFTVAQPSYSITYDANGGTGAPAAQTKTHDVALTLSSTKPTRANASAGSYTVTLDPNGGSVSSTSLTAARTTSYSFKNWNTKADGSGTTYASGASYTANAAATLYAQWNSSTTTVAVTLPTPTRTGYTFKGWATSASATSGTTGSYTPTGNVTLYAIWQANTYTVTYDANGGTGAPAAQTKTHDVALTLSSTKPTRANASAGSYTVTLDPNGGSVSSTSLTAVRTTSYSFKNWNTAANGSGTTYASGASYTANAAATLYAQWNSSTTTAAVTLPTPTREGYSFQGWATSGTATEGITGSFTPDADVTLYAVWQQNQVEPDPDALTLTLTDAEARPGETFTLTLQLTNNPGVTGLSAEVTFDESVMTLLSATPKIESGSWSVDSIAEDHLIFWYDTETFAGEDVIELSFRVADEAQEGDFPIGLQFGEWDSIVDAEGEEIADCTVVPGTLTVTHRVPGDINGDGRVNLSDVVRLAQYVKARGQGVEIVPNSGDTNGDGRVNLSDVVRLAQYVKARGVGVVIY
jgi:uncharacterized repeat protein (TIGR02543 family)